MLVDFHVHSTASDGTLKPSEILRAADEREFAAIALTDHDNCDGLDGWSGVKGIELSIEPGEGFNQFHLLGLGIDPTNAALKSFLRRILAGRNERNQRILRNFARIGIEIAAEDIAAYAHGEVLARPHFAQWLVKHRFARDNVEAFERYLKIDSPKETRCYEKRYHPSQEEAFSVIHGAGGLTVMAHPKYWKWEWRLTGCDFAMAERELRRLRDMGLDGVEALYQANTNEENVEFMRISTKLGFLKSAGSDFHGANKPTISLGMEVTKDYIFPLLKQLNLI